MTINISYIERDIDKVELDRLNQIFDQHTVDNGALLEKVERFGFVAEDKGEWIGCSSNLYFF